MRLIVPILALFSAATVTAADAPQPAPSAAERSPGTVIQAPGAGPRDGKPCRDTLQMVRAEGGLPSLDRENARPGEELLIAAVDQRIDGCSYMVMRNDTADVRAVPTAPGTPEVRRIQ